MKTSLNLKKIESVKGKVIIPGSKSLSNRALLVSSLAKGNTTLLNVLKSDDTARMIEALQTLSVKLNVNMNKIDIQGNDGVFSGDLCQKELYLGNAGTAMRPLCSVLSVSKGVYELTGEPRMMERPIGPLTEALKSIGLNIEYLNNDGFPPLLIRGSKVNSHEVSISGTTSSQFISALLMTAPVCGGLKIKIVGDLISKPYVDLTIDLIEKFGAKVLRNGYKEFEVLPTGYTSPTTYLIEGDATSATYFAAAAAIAGEIEIYGLSKSSVQGDFKFFSVLEQMGANVTYLENSVIVKKDELHGIDIDMNAMPDAAMTLVPMALYTDSPVTIRNIASWRVKETDRIQAMVNEMSKLGVCVSSGNDYISIDATQRNNITPSFDTYNDHRMAMCMSLVAFDREININDPECINKTFPTYFNLLKSVSC
ncbi:3-phosphoshikimate 1-carboxyvinyltransferase [Succinivibrio faecicola]|uniref:3-phosphoshikimate 1-carboxyvinyltransferase n=1 Tax=Succinivibrio faecicola TaxID=2820300 RepID=A0ABS7DGY4_9GAMM|nr:3-phosphoshikimate 1-carboxyvinyltransferase [Succinivibrio faecicola]MBW7570547.1 3-phosphoshikimate 1-carboxyvinyltransferase [Succinivibrio faecicola]